MGESPCRNSGGQAVRPRAFALFPGAKPDGLHAWFARHSVKLQLATLSGPLSILSLTVHFPPETLTKLVCGQFVS
jgi:hypothetical protein